MEQTSNNIELNIGEKINEELIVLTMQMRKLIRTLVLQQTVKLMMKWLM